MYDSIDDLPAHLKEELPLKARELYRAAYNRVVEKETTPGGHVREEAHAIAHDAGMMAVTGEFRRDRSGQWIHDPVADEMDEPDGE